MNIKKLSFSKKLRLTSSSEFIYNLKNSHKIVTKEIITFIKINNFNYPRIGIMIAKKYVRHAYKRNYIKRIIRENFRIHQHVLPNIDFIITIQKNITNSNYNSIQQTLHNIWHYSYDAYLKIINKTNIHISNTYQTVIE